MADAEGDAGYYALGAHNAGFDELTEWQDRLDLPAPDAPFQGKSATIRAFAAQQGIPFVELPTRETPIEDLIRRYDCPNCRGSGCWECEW